MHYRMIFEETMDAKPEAAKSLLAGYLSLFDKQPAISDRIKNDRLVEIDLFFLRGYCSRVNVYRDRKYQFQKVN